MSSAISFVAQLLGYIIRPSYYLTNNFGSAILLFVLFSKIILSPVSVWVHKNSIKLVQMQPAINWLKVKFFGDKDTIAEEQAKIFKQHRYNPLASIIPLAIQILLLLGLVEVINHPMRYLLQLPDDLIHAMSSLAGSLTGGDMTASSAQLSLISLIKSGAYDNVFLALGSQFPTVNLQTLMESIRAIRMQFFFIDLSWVPIQAGGIALVIPAAAAFSSWFLSHTQNHSQVLQSEQGNLSKYGLMLFSVGLSLYLGLFVTAGIALYWIASNLFTIVQTYLLNAAIPPNKHVDYTDLEKSRSALAALTQSDGGKAKKKLFQCDPNAKREKADYKRFFLIANKHLVFYSEKSGFYKYFENIIRELIKRSNVTIHYVTSDPDDAVFEMAKSQSRIKPYYISEKRLITLMFKMDADMVVMTMSDLDNYHIKRSYVRKDVEYVYLFHYPLSTHMVLHTGALDHYDTILCVGEFQFAEIRKSEEVYKLPPKKLVLCGYGQLEKLYADYEKMVKTERTRKKVLIAPSWQTNNILDSCIDALLNELLGRGFDVVVRPHPEYVKRYKLKMDAIVVKYAKYDGGDLSFELDFSVNTSIFDSDVVITDWSGTAYEFSFVTFKPAVFVDTQPKIHNEEYVKLNIEPLEFSLRDKMGLRVAPSALDGLACKLERLFQESGEYHATILELREQYIANFGRSGDVGCRYILDSLKARSAGNI